MMKVDREMMLRIQMYIRNWMLLCLYVSSSASVSVRLVEFEERDKGILAMSSEETRQEKTIINTVIDITNFGIV